MYKVGMSEIRYSECSHNERQQIKQMMQDFAHSAGIDPEFEMRWATIDDYNYMLAKLKYTDILSVMQVSKPLS